MKKNILMIISMALIVSFLFLVSVQFSVARVDLGMNNGTNLSASSGLITFTVNYTNITDLTSPTNATIFYNTSTGWSALGNITCQAAGSSCVGTLNVSRNASGANILGLFHTTFNVTIYNNTDGSALLGGANYSGWNTSFVGLGFTIDNQGPNVTNFNISNDLLNGLNFSSSIVKLNVTVNDSVMGYDPLIPGRNLSVYFNFTNDATGVTNASIVASSAVIGLYNATINTSWIVDGTYTVTVWANDSLGNWNSSAQRLSFTVDTTAPAITLTRNDASSSKSQLVIDVAVSDTTGTAGSCLADRVDAVRTGSGNSQTFTETGLTCGTGYVYKITCVDYLSFSTQTVATTFTTDTCSSSSGGSSGGSGGGSSTTTQVINAGSTVSVKESQISSSGGYSAKFGQDAKINFDLMSSASNAVQAHTLTVTRVGSNSATIVIASEPITLSVNVGEVKKVDVDGDGVYDVSVQLNAISSGKADLTVKKIDEASTSGSETGSVSEGEKAPIPIESNKNTKFIWIIALIIIVVVVIAIIYQKRK